MSKTQIKNWLKKIPYLSHLYWRTMRLFNYFKMMYSRSYNNWIKKSEAFSPYSAMKEETKFLLVLHFDELNNDKVQIILNSIIGQTYQQWQAVVFVDDVNKYHSFNDSRISFYHKADKDIPEIHSALNEKSWFMFINSHLALVSQALWEFNVAIKECSKNAECIYSDHDFLDNKGQRHSPNFKPDWNPDLYYEQDYIANACVYSSNAIRNTDVTELRTQDDFFNLIVNLNISDRSIILGHIPKILFHFYEDIKHRDAKHSQDSLTRRFKTDLIVTPCNSGQKVSWPIDTINPLVSLIIPTRNGLQILKQAIESIMLKTTYQNYEIIIVDNQSDDPDTIDYLNEITSSKIRVLSYDQPFNYSAINNFAVKQAKGSIIGLINNDVEVISPNWLSEMVSHAIRPDIGCVGAKLYYPNNTIQHAGVIIGMWGCAGHSHKYFERDNDGYNNRLQLVQNYSAVTAACLLVRRELFESVNGLNEDDLTVAFNDVDFCLKVEQLGVRNIWTPYAELYHHESISRGNDATPEKRARAEKEINYMHDTWGTNTYLDPAYNPNLTLKLEDFSISRDI